MCVFGGGVDTAGEGVVGTGSEWRSFRVDEYEYGDGQSDTAREGMMLWFRGCIATEVMLSSVYQPCLPYSHWLLSIPFF